MKPNRLITRMTLAVVAVTLCGLPEMAQAQTAPATSPQAQQQAPATGQQADAPAAQSNAQQQTVPAQNNAQQNNGMIDPSKGPLTPVPSNTQELPNAPSAAQAPAQSTTQSMPAQAPAGAAAAQTGPTAGGVASKPAGNAIAPAKQRQVRSLLIKLGVIAAAGAAIGTVVALSKGSPSTPPGTR